MYNRRLHFKQEFYNAPSKRVDIIVQYFVASTALQSLAHVLDECSYTVDQTISPAFDIFETSDQ